jgi:hypothetical protein
LRLTRKADNLTAICLPIVKKKNVGSSTSHNPIVFLGLFVTGIALLFIDSYIHNMIVQYPVALVNNLIRKGSVQGANFGRAQRLLRGYVPTSYAFYKKSGK